MATLDNAREDCVCRVCSGIRATVNQIYSVLKIYGWMLDTYVVDFFQDDLWTKLPSAWRNFLDEITPEELSKWLLRESESSRIWPLSLLALRKFIKQAEISRDHRIQSMIKCSLRNNKENSKEATNVKHEMSKCKTQLAKVFTSHRIKKKKSYEIDVISRITADCAQKAGCQCIVDIGSGMCHLAKVLAYCYGLHVVCIEQNEELLKEARNRDEKATETVLRTIPSLCSRSPHYLAYQIGDSDEADNQLLNRLGRIFADEYGISEESSGYGIIGLHTCGGLANSLLKLYASQEKARFICIISCCYMKFSLGEENKREFSMSNFFKTVSHNYKLSYAALEVACHAIEKHCYKLKNNQYDDLKVHGYRAVLEYLLIKKNPTLRHTRLKNTKITKNTTFERYCEVATQTLEKQNRITDLDFEREDVKNFLKQSKRVLIFGTLRFFLAPLVETLVLFDKFLYLSELKLSPSLNAEFDPCISPRNIVLVSIKDKSET